MARRQGSSGLKLESRWVGGLPLVNAVLDRLRVDPLLGRTLPPADPRSNLAPAKALGALLRNLVLNERRPIYTQAEWASRVETSLLGLAGDETPSFNDDRIGRALDTLFLADRAALMTELVLRAVREFDVDLDQLHNDSTTLTFSGQYAGANGQHVRGKPTLRVTYGHNKDHRPDLKQLLFVLTVSADGAVPVHYRAMDGNVSDSATHVDTWETLRRLVGRADFLYVADCKLCSRASLAHISKQGGRFITVLPRNRREDKWFRHFVQVHEPPWDEAVRRPNPRRAKGPEDVWKVVEAELPSREGYRIIWVWNSLMAARDADVRQACIEKAWTGIEILQGKLQGKRCRLRELERVREVANQIVADAGATRWVAAQVDDAVDVSFRQERRGRPGKATRYVRKERQRFSVSLKTRPEVIEQDSRSDGMFPLITNAQDLTPRQVLEAYKFQPRLEKRHEQLKNVEEVAPVYLKKVTRIEALLFLYFIALLVQALLEREVRRAMAREKIEMLPIYPEERECRAPSTERILDLFMPLQRHRLHQRGRLVQVFQPELDELQQQVLALLRIPSAAFTKMS